MPGVKPVGPMQWKLAAFYIYGAVEPLTGKSFFLEFPYLNSMCFQAFLNEFSQTYSDSLNLLQVDNASSHLAKNLILPENVILLFQPAYSPDVNPIERLWQSLKDKLRWLTIETLDELRREMDIVLNSLTPERIFSLTGYDFILAALKNAGLAT